MSPCVESSSGDGCYTEVHWHIAADSPDPPSLLQTTPKAEKCPNSLQPHRVTLRNKETVLLPYSSIKRNLHWLSFSRAGQC